MKEEAHASKRERIDRKKVQKEILEWWGLDSYVEMAKKPRHLQIFLQWTIWNVTHFHFLPPNYSFSVFINILNFPIGGPQVLSSDVACQHCPARTAHVSPFFFSLFLPFLKSIQLFEIGYGNFNFISNYTSLTSGFNFGLSN